MTLPFDVVEQPVKKQHKIVDRCHVCGKVAKERFSKDIKNKRIVFLECYHTVVREIPKGTPFHEFMTFEHMNNKCKHEWDKNHCLKCDAYKLYPFQVEGAAFIEQALATQRGVGLFDEPGLGKTIQPLAYLNYHPDMFPVLFIVKSRLRFQFFKAIIRWLGITCVAQILRSAKDPVLPGFKCYIVSFDLLRRMDTTQFIKAGIQLVVIDECQHIKNERSKRTQEVQDLVSEIPHVLPMSGTPWKNRGSEYFVALNMISPSKFPTKQGFLDRWVSFYQYGESYKEGGIRNIPEFREFTSDILIRRERQTVLPDLPVVNRTMHYCELDNLEQSSYDNEVSAFVEWYNDKVIGGEEDSFEVSQHILAKFQIMRHITGLAKIPETVELVTDHIEETQRSMVIFIHHIDVGDLMYDELSKKYKVFRLTGGMDPEVTTATVDLFNQASPAIAIASTLASGEGLDGLQDTCSDCIIHERQWNPANEEQAEGRLVRIGQEATSVNAVYVTAAETIDEHLASIIERKRIDFHAVMNNEEMPMWRQEDVLKDLALSLVNQEKSKLKRMASF